jgi:2-methylcitrate dehydratase PrpD
VTAAESRVAPAARRYPQPAEDGPTSLLARFVAEHPSEQIPEPVLHAARRALVDHIGVTVSGSADDATRRARDAVVASESGGDATVAGASIRVSPPFAAFLNAFASHVLDLDDVYNPPGTTVHGSCSVWPAILAVADTRPVAGRDALASFALGFEVETRVAHAAGQTHYDVGWHVTGTSGHVGAAAAAARTMGLGHKEIEHAIAAGATQAAGLRIMAGSDLKSMHPAKAAMDGVLAATFAAHDLTAGANALEGDYGYLAVMSTDPAPEKISARLGETWNLPDNGHKLYPSGSLTHPMIDGVIALMTDNDVAPGDVALINIRVCVPAARFTDQPRPTTAMQAKFSLRHCAAAAAVFRRVGPEELAPQILTRPDVVDLRDRVKVVADPALGKQDADVEITLASGRSLATQVRGNRGTPSAPLDDDELDAKFRELVGPVLGPERTERLLATCWRLDDLTDVSELLAQTVPAEPIGRRHSASEPIGRRHSASADG